MPLVTRVHPNGQHPCHNHSEAGMYVLAVPFLQHNSPFKHYNTLSPEQPIPRPVATDDDDNSTFHAFMSQALLPSDANLGHALELLSLVEGFSSFSIALTFFVGKLRSRISLTFAHN